MASAGVVQRLDQAPTGIKSSAPHQRASLKRPRPYHDGERPLPPRRPRFVAAESVTRGVDRAKGSERDSDEALEGEEEGDCDDDSEYEEDGGSSDEDEALVAKRKRQPRRPRAAAAAPPLPAKTKREMAASDGASSGEASKNPQSQRQQQKREAVGAPPRAGAGGRSRNSISSSSSSSGRGTQHKCSVCGKVFGKACKLARHAATHTGEKPFVCDEDGCSKAFSTKDKLRRHALSHARRKAGLSVSVGDAARREAEVRQRAALFEASAAASGVTLETPAEPSPYLLYTATAKATVPSLVAASRMERERVAGGGSGGSGAGNGTGGGWKHSCPTCGRNFLDNYHLKRHIKAIHEGPRPYKCDHPVAAASAAAAAAAVPVPTVAAAAAAGVAPAVAARDGAASGAQNGQRGEVAAQVAEAKEAPTGEGKDAGSAEVVGAAASGVVGTVQKAHGVCGAAFAKKWQLREHLYWEHGQTKFNSRQHRCPHPGCGREFDRPSKLASHEKTHEARFVCQFSGCGAAFVLASGLNLHLKEEHPFRCGVCDKMFDREDKMQIHRGTHARAGDGDFIRPYPCNVPGCGKSFTEKRNLNAHRRTRHTEGGRKRFRCEVGGCTMAFAHRHTLVKHVKREHQGSPSSFPSSDSGKNQSTNATGEVELGKGKRQGTAKANPGAPSQRQESHKAAAEAASGTVAVGARDPEEAKRDAEAPAESSKGQPAQQSTKHSDKTSVPRSPVSSASPAESRIPVCKV